MWWNYNNHKTGCVRVVPNSESPGLILGLPQVITTEFHETPGHSTVANEGKTKTTTTAKESKNNFAIRPPGRALKKSQIERGERRKGRQEVRKRPEERREDGACAGAWKNPMRRKSERPALFFRLCGSVATKFRCLRSKSTSILRFRVSSNGFASGRCSHRRFGCWGSASYRKPRYTHIQVPTCVEAAAKKGAKQIKMHK